VLTFNSVWIIFQIYRNSDLVKLILSVLLYGMELTVEEEPFNIEGTFLG
jgi:hypothetical protein